MPKTGHFILHSNVIPQLTAGKYELVTEHKDLPFTVVPEHTHITVTAPRFTMPTDQILSSFPPANAEGAFGDLNPQLLGDVVISTQTARVQAEHADRHVDDELDALLIHGILHLIGYDHERSAADARAMRGQERRLRRLLQTTA